MDDNSPLRAALMSRQNMAFDYPNMQSALNDTDQQARLSMYGPQAGLQANLRAETGQNWDNEVAAQPAREAAAASSLRDALLSLTPAAPAVAAKDAYNAAQNHDWLGTGLGILGALPLVGMFGGALAKTANASKLERAINMVSEGHPPENIWKETGWFKGLDGNWKHEIDDSKAMVRSGQGVGVGPDSPLYHPDVDAAYPGIKGLKVDIASEGQNPGNEMSFYERMNTKNGPALQARGFDPNDRKFVAMHELQHAIDDQEGILAQAAQGKIPYQWPSERAAREASYRMNMTPEERMANPPVRLFEKKAP